MSDEFVPQRNFEAVRATWEPFSNSHRIIPFCTPLFVRPAALVIGTNHSDFVDGGGIAADEIADELAARLPKQSTFLVHDHKFAHELSKVCSRAGIRIDETWMGTIPWAQLIMARRPQIPLALLPQERVALLKWNYAPSLRKQLEACGSREEVMTIGLAFPDPRCLAS